MTATKGVPDELVELFEASVDAEPEVPIRLTELPKDEQVVYRNCKGTPVGKLCYSVTHDEVVYFSLRNDARNHYYRAHSGYAIDDDIVFDLAERGISRLIIGRAVQKSVLEFRVEDYVNYVDGDAFDHGFGPQRITPLENAVSEWPNALETLFDEDDD